MGNLLAYSGLLQRVSPRALGLRRGTNLVMESSQAYNRTLYPLHQELEFAVSYDRSFTVLYAIRHLFEKMLLADDLPFGTIEVRFTPAGHERSLIGAGRKERSVWLDVIYYDSRGGEAFYGLVEGLMMAVGGRPHLGKWNRRVGSRYLATVHGPAFERFRELVLVHDPEGKFVNAYTRRLFDPATG